MTSENKSKIHLGSKEPKASNPYLLKLHQTIDEIMQLNVADIRPEALNMAHINPDNDWIYRKLAGMALVLAYAWGAPRTAVFHQKTVWLQMEKLLNRILDNCKNGKWWREQPGTGDANINRFTLLPLTELFIRVGNHFDSELKRKCLAVIEQATSVQVETYHNVKTRCRGEYPNMDAYFMLIMEETARILNRAQYHSLALEYLGYLETCLFADGGFVYYKDTNECEAYHQINVMILARFWELTHSCRILEILKRTLPYYPNTLEPSGVIDGYTDPFWKHNFGASGPFALDVLATLFPSAPEAGEHRYLANRLRDSSDEIWMLHLWAIDYWEAEPGTETRDNYVRYDASIRGPRGRFGAFSWAGTTGACLDTFVGAMIAEKRERISSLQAVGAEIILPEPVGQDPRSPLKGRRIDQSAYITGRDYLRRIIYADELACLGVSSPLFTGEVAWQDFVPDSGWQTHQVWLFKPERLIGMIVIEPAHGDTVPAKAAGIYFRLGGTGRDVIEKNGVFLRDELCLRLVKHNLAACSVEPAYAFYLDAKHTSTEVMLSTAITVISPKSLMAIVEIFPAWQKPANIVGLSSENMVGFVLSDAGIKTMAALNYRGTTVELAELQLEGKGRLFRVNSNQPYRRPAMTAAVESISSGELILMRNNGAM